MCLWLLGYIYHITKHITKQFQMPHQPSQYPNLSLNKRASMLPHRQYVFLRRCCIHTLEHLWLRPVTYDLENLFSSCHLCDVYSWQALVKSRVKWRDTASHDIGINRQLTIGWFENTFFATNRLLVGGTGIKTERVVKSCGKVIRFFSLTNLWEPCLAL